MKAAVHICWMPVILFDLFIFPFVYFLYVLYIFLTKKKYYILFQYIFLIMPFYLWEGQSSHDIAYIL